MTVKAVRKLDLKEFLKEAKEFNKDLRKRTRNEEDLIIPVELIIKSIVNHTNYLSIRPHSEMIFKERSSSYSAGCKLYTEIFVNSSKEICIEKLTYQGFLPLEKGDRIRAYIFIGQYIQEKAEDFNFNEFSAWESSPLRLEMHLVGREFKKEELTEKVEKIGKYNDVVATYLIDSK